ncbi:hypothetical protein RAS1_18440 [Phycisphaerae bacterium RAS1]|nr:hypothetical protein RAS1_18440 [Phycisphaerae bacterium RAS1]
MNASPPSQTTHLPHARPGAAAADVLTSAAAILALSLLAFPALSRVSGDRSQAVCLANLQHIGAAMLTYSAEDSREHAIPIHRMVITQGVSPTALWYTTSGFSVGGASGTEPYRLTSSVSLYLNESDPLGRRWAARTRPLNRYIGATPDAIGVDAVDPVSSVFRCPSDVGVPGIPLSQDTFARWLVSGNWDRPLSPMLGNSYILAGFTIFTSAFVGANAFSISPIAHRLSTLPNPERLPGLADAPFRSHTYGLGFDQVFDTKLHFGWHGDLMMDNVQFLDGSARYTFAGRVPVQPADDVCSDIDDTFNFVRGAYYQLDCYPTPCARLMGSCPDLWMPPSWFDCWPVRDYEDNLSPPCDWRR